MRARVGDGPLPEWDAAILVFQGRERSRTILERMPGKPLTGRPFSGLEAGEVYEVDRGGGRVGILANIGSRFGGGPLAVALVEELAVLGVPFAIGLGCAGSIHPDLRRGRQFVVSRALPTDGASRHYLEDGAAEAGPDPRLLSIADSLAPFAFLDVRRVTAATVDAIYRETPENVRGWREMGAGVINMEITPFYAAARACGVAAIYVGHVSDELFGPEWRDWFGEDRKRMLGESADLAIALLDHLPGRRGT
jgi:purine-nucleoside phosphorylase